MLGFINITGSDINNLTNIKGTVIVIYHNEKNFPKHIYDFLSQISLNVYFPVVDLTHNFDLGIKHFLHEVPAISIFKNGVIIKRLFEKEILSNPKIILQYL